MSFALAPDSPIVAEQDGHVLTLRINRPEAMNALNTQALNDLIAAVKYANKDESVHCMVLTGNPRADGRPCFSAGDDLKEAAAGIHQKGNPGNVLCNALDDSLVPSIAVIDGVCTTGALEISLACDLRVVARTAQVSDWHMARLGSGLGGWGASTRLSRLVGVAQAKDIILTGKVIDGAEALRIGFAQRLYDGGELWSEAMAMAHAIAGMNPHGVRMTMAHLSRVEDLSKEESLAFAKQVRTWFVDGGTFADRAKAVLEDKNKR